MGENDLSYANFSMKCSTKIPIGLGTGGLYVVTHCHYCIGLCSETGSSCVLFVVSVSEEQRWYSEITSTEEKHPAAAVATDDDDDDDDDDDNDDDADLYGA